MSAVSYWIWLSALAVSPRAKSAVIHRFGDAEKAFFSPAGALAATEGVSPTEGTTLERRDLCSVQEILEDCAAQGLSIVTLQDAAYPARLKQIASPPVVLYVKGKLGAIDDESAIAVVGTRSASPYGLKMSRQLAWEITRCGGLVVSGLTNGVDAAAADGALAAGGSCIGVLGTAHEQQDGELAARVAERGALISEYAPGTRSLRSHFRDRNRISAGLSVGRRWSRARRSSLYPATPTRPDAAGRTVCSSRERNPSPAAGTLCASLPRATRAACRKAALLPPARIRRRPRRGLRSRKKRLTRKRAENILTSDSSSPA